MLVDAVDREIPEVGIQINTFENIIFSKESLAMELFRAATGMPNIVRPYREIEEPIAKVIFGETDADRMLRLIELLEAHPLADKFNFTRSESILFEILPKNITKATALEDLCEYLSVPIERTVAVGDYSNDVAMLKAAGIGIAVANASADAKEAADLVTVGNDEHAIARIINDMDRGAVSLDR